MNSVHLAAMLAVPLLAGVAAVPAHAGDPSRASEASELSAEGSVTVAKGSLTGIAGSADFVVTSVELLGEGLDVVLKNTVRAGEVALRVPKYLVGGMSLAVGQTVTLVAKGAGWAIESAGRIIGFIPNEAGRQLLHAERVPEGTEGGA